MTESRVYHRKMLSSATDNTWWHIQRESLGVLIGNPPPPRPVGFALLASPSHLYDTEILASIWSHITTQQWVHP